MMRLTDEESEQDGFGGWGYAHLLLCNNAIAEAQSMFTEKGMINEEDGNCIWAEGITD